MADKVTFDGTSSLIIVKDGITELDAKVDIYSDWKEWVRESDNSKWPQALRAVGGDELTGGQTISAYYFLTNGWRIRPYEGDHRLTIEGNLFVDGGGSPFVTTLSNYNVLIELILSSKSVDVPTEVGVLTPEELELLQKIYRRTGLIPASI